MSTLPLFPEPPSFRERLAARLAELAARGILIGTSSWKYPGWMGQIYTEDRYKTRGRFSQKRFEETCLAEYAETFPIVCGDFAFYQFPSDAYWQRLFALTPPQFRFAFKVPEEITVKRWPKHARYGSRAGLDNPSFLDATMFERLFLDPLAAYGERLALLIFEFGTFAKSDFESVEQFAEVLHAFLACLPARCRYAVEIRNREYLDPAYFDCLRQRGVAHVFNAWTRMPELDRQMKIEDAYTADFTVTRALLAAGRTYEQAVELFSPYTEVKQPNPAVRTALKWQMERAASQARSAYVFVNNRMEGNAPATIQNVVAVS